MSPFTPAESLHLRDAITNASMPLFGGSLNPLALAEELQALAKTTHELMETDYKDNEFLQEIHRVSALDETDQEYDSQDPPGDMTSESYWLEQTSEVLEMVRSRVGDANARAFGELMFRVAEQVANASGGGFFGTKKDTSEEEQAYLDKLKQVVAI